MSFRRVAKSFSKTVKSVKDFDLIFITFDL